MDSIAAFWLLLLLLVLYLIVSVCEFWEDIVNFFKSKDDKESL